MDREALNRFGDRVGYSEEDLESIPQGDSRTRHIGNIAKVAASYSIEAKLVKSIHCNSGYRVGDRFVLDVDGNFIGKLCPKKLCVYAISQLAIPVALINERLSEGLSPNEFHFMHNVRCLDVGVECKGYGGIMMEVKVIPR
ncbi:hypothetical protein ACFL2Q_17455 [Thermodesulfobacteriota bacterium]